jgi:succinate dehydrogenase/fumarate reductase flavoprotein subunit
LINSDQEDFMWEVDPAFGPFSDARNSARAMAREVHEGRGPIFMDRTTYMYGLVGQHIWASSFTPGTWQGDNEAKILESGFDVLTTLQPFTVNSFGVIGAVRANVDCSTDLEGLYVASTAISHDPGKTKGIESARAFWSGEKAALTASSYLSTKATPPLDNASVEAQLEELKAPLGRPGSLFANDLIEKMQQSLFNYRTSILKTEMTMLNALSVVRECKEELEEIAVHDAHELAKYYEAHNLVTLAELHLLAGIERKESRVCHFRDDFPQRDDANWLKWINFTRGEDGEPVMSLEDVPLDTYRFQPQGEA